MIKNKKVGGIRFLSFGRVSITVSVKRAVTKESNARIYSLTDTGIADAAFGTVCGFVGAAFLVALFA